MLFLSGISDAKSVLTGQEGHGGIVVVCPGKKPELLDLWEAENLPGLKGKFKIKKSTGSLEDEIEEALTHPDLSDKNKRVLLDEISRIQDTWIDLPGSQRLVSLSNADVTILPQGCELRNVVTYLSETIIYKDPELLALLTPTHQKALLIHEAVQQVCLKQNNCRRYHPSVVKLTRRTTALLMSAPSSVAQSKNLKLYEDILLRESLFTQENEGRFSTLEITKESRFLRMTVLLGANVVLLFRPLGSDDDQWMTFRDKFIFNQFEEVAIPKEFIETDHEIKLQYLSSTELTKDQVVDFRNLGAEFKVHWANYPESSYKSPESFTSIMWIEHPGFFETVNTTKPGWDKKFYYLYHSPIMKLLRAYTKEEVNGFKDFIDGFLR